MQCNCGASTQQKTAVRAKHKARLEYQECPRCGRVEIEVLLIGGDRIASGRDAQAMFARLDDE